MQGNSPTAPDTHLLQCEDDYQASLSLLSSAMIHAEMTSDMVPSPSVQVKSYRRRCAPGMGSRLAPTQRGLCGY